MVPGPASSFGGCSVVTLLHWPLLLLALLVVVVVVPPAPLELAVVGLPPVPVVVVLVAPAPPMLESWSRARGRAGTAARCDVGEPVVDVGPTPLPPVPLPPELHATPLAPPRQPRIAPAISNCLFIVKSSEPLRRAT